MQADGFDRARARDRRGRKLRYSKTCDGKVRYRDRNQASAAATRTMLRYYHCVRCLGFHLTKSEQN